MVAPSRPKSRSSVLVYPFYPRQCVAADYSLSTTHYPLSFLPPSSTQLLCFLSHPCNSSSFMRLRTLLRNGAPLSLLFSMASALFLSPRGHASKALPTTDSQTSNESTLFVYKSLAPLCPLFAPFSASVSFVFNRLQPLFQKHPGGGVPAFVATWKASAAALFERVKR